MPMTASCENSWAARLRNARFLRPILGAASVLIAIAGAALPSAAAAEDAPFARGWTLDPAASTLGFQSVKNGSVVATSGFATYTGTIAEDGTAELRFLLDSVDTKVDLRNVRMRFLFFETFRFPEAVVTTRVDPALLADLPTVRRKSLALPFSLDMHGVVREMQAEVTVTLLGDDRVAIASGAPVMLKGMRLGASW